MEYSINHKVVHVSTLALCHIHLPIYPRVHSNDYAKDLSLHPDEDLNLWRNHLNELSDKWVNGYDKGQVLTHGLLYDLSSIPSFYLLDKDKKVLLKDADWRQVTQFFEK